jgi:hypothetical protein
MEAKVFRTFITIYYLFTIEGLSALSFSSSLKYAITEALDMN